MEPTFVANATPQDGTVLASLVLIATPIRRIRAEGLVGLVCVGVCGVALALMAPSAFAQNITRSAELGSTDHVHAEHPPVAPPKSIIDYGVDRAMEFIRNWAKKKKLTSNLILDLAERLYRIIRNEQELAMWRREARRMLLELNLLTESLDAEIDRSTAFDQQINYEVRRIDAELKDLYERIHTVGLAASAAQKLAKDAHARIDAVEYQSRRAAKFIRMQVEEVTADVRRENRLREPGRASIVYNKHATQNTRRDRLWPRRLQGFETFTAR